MDQYLQGKKLKVVYTAQVSANGRTLPHAQSPETARYVVKAFRPVDSNSFSKQNQQWTKVLKEGPNLENFGFKGDSITPTREKTERHDNDVDTLLENSDSCMVKLCTPDENEIKDGVLPFKDNDWIPNASHGR